MKSILSVFASYCDAYLEYTNNFLTIDCFCEHYDIRKSEFSELMQIIQNELRKTDLPVLAIDYYMNRRKGEKAKRIMFDETK